MMLEVVDTDDPIEVGAETVYEIKVLNQGSCTGTGVQILATIPVGMAPRGASGPTPYRFEGQQMVFEPLERLSPRAEVVYRVRVLCQQPGDYRFRVQMRCNQLSSPVIEEESTRIYQD